MPGMVVAKLGAPQPALSGPQTMCEMYGSRAAAADLCQRELTNQRMHRYPVPQPEPYRNPDAYMSTASRSFGAPSQPGRGTPCFTIAFKNDICTKTVTTRMSVAELKSQQAPMQAEDGRVTSYKSTSMSSFAAPDGFHPTKGASAPRGGVAGRMPFSEVDRRFYTSTSDGTLPGDPAYAPGGGKFDATSETRAQFDRKPIAPREAARVTVRRLNDLGTRESSHAVPPDQLLRTNYELGTEKTILYSTAAREAAAAPPPNSWKLIPSAAGQQVRVGPSEVERGFRQPHNSADYNIISNGPALGTSHGGSNTDIQLRQRNAAAFERPVGLQQHPTNSPADRGPTGSRQSYDIITGRERPRERWNFQS